VTVQAFRRVLGRNLSTADLETLPAAVNGFAPHARASDPTEDEALGSSGLPAAASRGRTFERMKRAMDVLGAAVLIVALAPVMVAIVISTYLDSGGSVLFRDQRTGLRGRRFLLYKFRTMQRGACQDGMGPGGLSWLERRRRKCPGDPRVTRVGRVLRAWSLDEIPNLVNVLRGDMSLVGPRPHLLEGGVHAPWQPMRLSIRPGVTGLAQVNGRSDLSVEEEVRLDLIYVETRSLGFDLRILGRTVMAVLSRRGAY
jgi:lipopolysaccharide/colanic/teichoic acid biosynthesis glycosyltransferase